MVFSVLARQFRAEQKENMIYNLHYSAWQKLCQILGDLLRCLLDSEDYEAIPEFAVLRNPPRNNGVVVLP